MSEISFCVTFHFEIHSILSDIPFFMTFSFEWHSFWVIFHYKWHFLSGKIIFEVTFHLKWYFILIDIPLWVTSQFEWPPSLSDIPFWVTFHVEWHSIFEWHSVFSDILFWMALHFEWHSILSDEIWEIWGIWRTVNFQSTNKSVSIIRTKNSSASKNMVFVNHNTCFLSEFQDYVTSLKVKVKGKVVKCSASAQGSGRVHWCFYPPTSRSFAVSCIMQYSAVPGKARSWGTITSVIN